MYPKTLWRLTVRGRDKAAPCKCNIWDPTLRVCDEESLCRQPPPTSGTPPSGPGVSAPSTTMVLLPCKQLWWPMLRTLCWPRQSLFIRGRGRWPRCRGGVPVRFPFCVPTPFGPWWHTGGQESTFRDIAKLLLKHERYYVRDIVPITVLCGCEVAFPRWCGRNVYAIGGAACVFRAVGFSQYFCSCVIASGSREWGD